MFGDIMPGYEALNKYYTSLGFVKHPISGKPTFAAPQDEAPTRSHRHRRRHHREEAPASAEEPAKGLRSSSAAELLQQPPTQQRPGAWAVQVPALPSFGESASATAPPPLRRSASEPRPPPHRLVRSVAYRPMGVLDPSKTAPARQPTRGATAFF
mmetsp:Transcript_117905/g.375902  ORF Transcript_117905/g.375902 Transcript_117905/m.375902 type:complete len:155 (+) Transcript_117905:394-858(+)